MLTSIPTGPRAVLLPIKSLLYKSLTWQMTARNAIVALSQVSIPHQQMGFIDSETGGAVTPFFPPPLELPFTRGISTYHCSIKLCILGH